MRQKCIQYVAFARHTYKTTVSECLILNTTNNCHTDVLLLIKIPRIQILQRQHFLWFVVFFLNLHPKQATELVVVVEWSAASSNQHIAGSDHQEMHENLILSLPVIVSPWFVTRPSLIWTAYHEQGRAKRVNGFGCLVENISTSHRCFRKQNRCRWSKHWLAFEQENGRVSSHSAIVTRGLWDRTLTSPLWFFCP